MVTLKASVLASGFAIVAGAAAADDVATNVDYCMTRTGVPGTYAISEAGDVPQVVPSAGGTQRGAAWVNDCLLDRYQVQFASVQSTPVLASDRAQLSQCESLLQRRGGEAFLRSVGVSILFGGIGAGIHASTVTGNFRRCIESGAYDDRLQSYDGIALASSCGRGSNVFKGGSGYCRD